mmetsp:Transcript_46740/g.138065  ORF Transcript_46740/g.138065 Transcript_46740/m.138065 type:complete len:240 (-) Transcript_46740:43-762(-)
MQFLDRRLQHAAQASPPSVVATEHRAPQILLDFRAGVEEDRGHLVLLQRGAEPHMLRVAQLLVRDLHEPLEVCACWATFCEGIVPFGHVCTHFFVKGELLLDRLDPLANQVGVGNVEERVSGIAARLVALVAVREDMAMELGFHSAVPLSLLGQELLQLRAAVACAVSAMPAWRAGVGVGPEMFLHLLDLLRILRVDTPRLLTYSHELAFFSVRTLRHGLGFHGRNGHRSPMNPAAWLL